MITCMQSVAVPGWYPSQPGIERWWDGQQWTEHVRPVQVVQPWRQPEPASPSRFVTRSPKRTSHGFHLLMTLLTFGMWAPFVWLPVTIWNSIKRDKGVTRPLR